MQNDQYKNWQRRETIMIIRLRIIKLAMHFDLMYSTESFINEKRDTFTITIYTRVPGKTMASQISML